MVMKLYGLFSSPFVNNVAFTLHEKNADFEPVFADGPIIKSEEYLATKNPFGRMPAFEDDDLVLFESRAIVRYIVDKFEGQGTSLLGSTPKERALVNVWIEVEAQSFYPAAWSITRELYGKKVPDAALLDTNREKLGKVLDIYEAQLSKHKYLAGDFFSLADLFHIPVLHMLLSIVDPVQRTMITSRPRVNSWYEDVAARPAWQKILQIPAASDWSYIPKV